MPKRSGPTKRPLAIALPSLPTVDSSFSNIVNPGNGDGALVDARADVPGTVTQVHPVRDGRAEEDVP